MNPSRPAFDVNQLELGPGLTLLEASAGTGKTWSLTTLAARALVEGRLDDIGQLLMVTFTKSATDDLRTRLRARVQETLKAALRPETAGDDAFLRTVAEGIDAAAIGRLRRALRDFDRARIHTIHSYCARLLQETAFEAGASLELGEPTDASALRRAALEDAWRDTVVEGPAWLIGLAALAGWSPLDLEKFVDAQARHRRLEVRPAGEDLEVIGARVATALAELEQWTGVHDALAALDPIRRDPIQVLTKDGLEKHGSSLAYSLHALASADVSERRLAWIGLALHLRVAARNTWCKKVLDHAPWSAALSALGSALEPAQDALRETLLARTRTRLRRNKQREETLDYDDLIERVRAALDDPRRRAQLVRLAHSTTRMACIDEFQDTDVDQWEIFRTLFGENVTLVLVGDPKQAIYGFRGADVFAYLDARAEVHTSGGEEFGLERNFRSHPDLVEAVNVLFGRGTAAFAVDGIEHAGIRAHHDAMGRELIGDPGPAFRIATAQPAHSTKPAHERAVIDRMVGEIRRLLGAGITLASGNESRPLGPGDIAVLTRTHRQSARVHRALREAGIASVLGRSGDVHQSEAMEELGLLLAAILDPRDTRVVRRALTTRLWGGTLSTLEQLDEDDAALARVHDTLEDLRRLWHRHGVLVAADRFLHRHRVAARLLGEADGDRLLTDLRHALELVHRAALEGDLSPVGTLAWLWRERTRDHTQDEQRQLRLDRDDDAVRILTAHGSKGLEFEVVFVPFAWEGAGPSAPLQWHETVDGQRTLVIDARALNALDPADRGRAEREALAEELRLLYVALTRAKRRCVVVLTDYHWNDKNTAGRSALFYLLHRAQAGAEESREDYVDRCIAELSAGRQGWTPIVPRWLEAHPSIGEVPPETGTGVGAPAVHEDVVARARTLPPDLAVRLVPWSLVSFTSLVRQARDGREAVESEATETAVAERADPPATPAALRSAQPTGIFAFARGARAGVCLHEILERSDFDRPLDGPGRSRIGRILARHGLALPQVHAGPIDPQAVAEQLVLTAAAERFPLGDFTLSEIDRAHRLDEWEFRAALGRVRVRALAELFARHAGAPWNRLLPPRLQRLDDQVVEGLLGGFVDLVFEHDGRWFVVDWKSNHLGDMVDDYESSAIGTAMLEHDYVLQLTLYTVAVHRFLGRRLPGYRYDEHFGGAAYAFFRGWCGRPDRGWFAWQPPRALVEAIDAALTPGGTR